MHLKNKTAFIAGATGSIGENIAFALAEQGVNLILHYRNNHEKAQEILAKMQSYKIQCCFTQAELNDFNQIKNVFQIHNKFDILVNCIGDFHFQPLKELEPKKFQEIINSNLQIAYELCYCALPCLRANLEGRILNFGYANASQVEAKSNILPYHISKMGLILLTKSLAASEAENNILVNCLSPAIVENSKYWPKKNNFPLKRPAKLIEISEAALFLLKSDYITGSNLEIDGGWRGVD